MAAKAVFLDRDGTLTELIYDSETGHVDSAARPGEVRLVEGVGEALRGLKERGFKLIVVSNQPGVAKGRQTLEDHEQVSARIRELLEAEGVRLDAEYYCLHHPRAVVEAYRVKCGCRKPAPGLIMRAVEDHGLDAAQCFMVGDDISDVKAAVAAGVPSVYLGHATGLLFEVFEREGVRPDALASSIAEAASYISSMVKGLTKPRADVKFSKGYYSGLTGREAV